MIVVVVVISVVLVAGAVGYIGYLFHRDNKIRSQGRDIRAMVDEVRFITANDNGNATIRYRLSWPEGDSTKAVDGKEVIPAFYSSQVQRGREVRIKYLDDDTIMFVFDK